MAMGKAESRQTLGPWERGGGGAFWKDHLGGWNGDSQRETTSCPLPASHHGPHSPLDGGSRSGTVTVLEGLIIPMSTNYYSKNCWPNFENLTMF